MPTKSKKFSATTKRMIIKKTFAVVSSSLPRNIFKKSSFPAAPGGDRYEWKEAETTFEISKDGLFVIKIEASAKDAKQNKGADDDDLCVALDGFDFGKYEQNQEQISWKGFNTSSSFNGATLRGGTKTVYYFVNLNKGLHVLQFFADKIPALKNIEVFEVKNHAFELQNIRPSENIKNEHHGIPWLSFVFLGLPSKSLAIGAKVRSAKSKGASDGDNLKVAVNGTSVLNPIATTSDKYKNFYFSGDLKQFDVLTITDKDLAKSLAFENTVELWYDEEPEITSLKIEFFNDEEFLKTLESLGIEDLRHKILGWIHLIIFGFRVQHKKYSAEFLSHALKSNPQPLVFSVSDPIISLIKKDPIYKKIMGKIKEKIGAGNLNGEIWPEDFKKDPEMDGQINFDSFDLKTSIHGLKKIEYSTMITRKGSFDVEITLFDIYDFEKKILPLLPFHIKEFFRQAMVNWVDLWEELGIIKNFEVEIHLTEYFDGK